MKGTWPNQVSRVLDFIRNGGGFPEFDVPFQGYRYLSLEVRRGDMRKIYYFIIIFKRFLLKNYLSSLYFMYQIVH